MRSSSAGVECVIERPVVGDVVGRRRVLSVVFRVGLVDSHCDGGDDGIGVCAKCSGEDWAALIV
jgi:hypothetical protein